MTRIAVIGGGGQLGTAFRMQESDAKILTRRELDLRDPDSFSSVLDAIEPNLLINCAAYTAVDKAEEEEGLATAVNGSSVGILASYCQSRNIRFVTYSTDYVFPGDSDRPWVETDSTSPINAYGRSKLVGEELALQTEALIIRTSWVVSATHPNFVATILRLAATRELKVVDDQRGSPTFVADLARATLEAVESGATGLLHLTNSGETTWFDLAKAAVELADLDPERLEPCTTAEYPTVARRPAYSVLESERAAGLGVAALPDWRDSLPGVVEALYRNGVVEPR